MCLIAVEIAKLFENIPFYIMYVAYCLTFVMIPMLSKFRNSFGVETYECALAKKHEMGFLFYKKDMLFKLFLFF